MEDDDRRRDGARVIRLSPIAVEAARSALAAVGEHEADIEHACRRTLEQGRLSMLVRPALFVDRQGRRYRSIDGRNATCAGRPMPALAEAALLVAMSAGRGMRLDYRRPSHRALAAAAAAILCEGVRRRAAELHDRAGAESPGPADAPPGATDSPGPR